MTTYQPSRFGYPKKLQKYSSAELDRKEKKDLKFVGSIFLVGPCMKESRDGDGKDKTVKEWRIHHR